MIDGSLTSSLVTGSLPAVDGSALTGAGAGIDTETTSDPTSSTNPSGTGHLWVNKSSGEMFICTDATAGFNIWVNIGGGSHGYAKPFGGIGGGTISGFIAGGYAGNASFQITRTIEEYSLVTDGNKSAHGNLVARGTEAAGDFGTGFNVGNASTTHGYSSGGDFRTPWQNTNAIDKFAFASNTTAVDQGDLVTVLNYAGSQSSSTHGYVTGGYKASSPTARRSAYQRFSFSSAGNASDVGTLITGVQSNFGQSSNTHGYQTGGYNTSDAYVNSIERFSFASNGATTDVGNLTQAVQNGASVSSASHGYLAGGSTGSNTDRIEKFAFTSSNNATAVGSLTSAFLAGGSASAVTHGYVVGGSGPIDTVQKWAYASDGTASNIGTLTAARQNGASSQF